jgi:histidyl-tRNA synthetase
VEQFGGKPTPAVGFAAGIERMLLLTEGLAVPARVIDAYMVHSGGESLKQAIGMAALLRDRGLSADLDPAAKGFKAQFKKADREGARFALIIGDDEAAAGTCTIKDLKTGQQQTLPPEQCAAIIAQD